MLESCIELSIQTLVQKCFGIRMSRAMHALHVPTKITMYGLEFCQGVPPHPYPAPVFSTNRSPHVKHVSPDTPIMPKQCLYIYASFVLAFAHQIAS